MSTTSLQTIVYLSYLSAHYISTAIQMSTTSLQTIVYLSYLSAHYIATAIQNVNYIRKNYSNMSFKAKMKEQKK